MDEIVIEKYGDGKKAVVVLTGLGGNTRGFGDKYAHMAEAIQKRGDYTAFIAATPKDVWERPQAAFDEVMKRTCGFTEVYLFGNSAGGNLALGYAHLYPSVERVLAVNPVLNLNPHVTRDGLKNFRGERMSIVIGALDPSAAWARILPEHDNLTVVVLPDTDHVFSGKIDEFISLPERYLLDQ